MISDMTVTLLTSVALTPCCDMRENVERSSSRPSSHETSEIDKSFTAFVQSPSTDYAESLRNLWMVLLPYFLFFIPRSMMLCISNAFGIPRIVAGLKPNGPPSVFAANVMPSP